MISASAALFQTATNSIRAVTARAEALAWQAPLWLNFFGIGKYYPGAYEIQMSRLPILR
jgi:hypothetical protein